MSKYMLCAIAPARATVVRAHGSSEDHRVPHVRAYSTFRANTQARSNARGLLTNSACSPREEEIPPVCVLFLFEKHAHSNSLGRCTGSEARKSAPAALPTFCTEDLPQNVRRQRSAFALFPEAR